LPKRPLNAGLTVVSAEPRLFVLVRTAYWRRTEPASGRTHV
jgi:hypothetical protein